MGFDEFRFKKSWGLSLQILNSLKKLWGQYAPDAYDSTVFVRPRIF